MRDICLFLFLKKNVHLLNRQVFKKNANQGCHDLGDLSELGPFSIITDALGEVTAAHLDWGEG